MKIAFDEHVPPRVVRILTNLVAEGLIEGVEIYPAKDYAPADWTPDMGERSDVPWLRKFAEDGGRIVITGDKRMRTKPHERLAPSEFATFMFHPRWNHYDAFKRTAVLDALMERNIESSSGVATRLFLENPRQFGMQRS